MHGAIRERFEGWLEGRALEARESFPISTIDRSSTNMHILGESKDFSCVIVWVHLPAGLFAIADTTLQRI